MRHTVAVAIPTGSYEAMPMLAKQKIIEEAGCSLLREQIPGQGDQQGEQESPEPRKTWEYQSGLTRQNRPEARGQQDENQCNRSLGQ